MSKSEVPYEKRNMFLGPFFITLHFCAFGIRRIGTTKSTSPEEDQYYKPRLGESVAPPKSILNGRKKSAGVLPCTWIWGNPRITNVSSSIFYVVSTKTWFRPKRG